MRDRVDAAREPGDDRHAVRGEVARQLARRLPPVRRRTPRPDDGERPFVLRRERPADVDQRGRVGNLAQPGGVGGVEARDRAHPGLGEAFQLPLRVDLRPLRHHEVHRRGVQAGRAQRRAIGLPRLLERRERALEVPEAHGSEAGDAVEGDPPRQSICSYIVHVHSLPAVGKGASAGPDWWRR